MEERVRKHVAERDPHNRGADPKQQRLKAQNQQYLVGVEALHPQIGDEAPALGDREQHRVERQQEAHHPADRGKQRGRLVGRLLRAAQLAQFFGDRLHVEAPGGQPPKLAGDECFGAGRRLDEYLRDAFGLARERLCERQQRDRHGPVPGRVGERAGEHETNGDRVRLAVGIEHHPTPLAGADRTRHFRRQTQASDEQQL